MHNRDSRRGKKREKGMENIFEEVMAENFPNLKKETHIQEQEAKMVPNKMNWNSRHSINKMSTVKERDFPGGSVVMNPPANAGDTGSIPGPKRCHMLWGY